MIHLFLIKPMTTNSVQNHHSAEDLSHPHNFLAKHLLGLKWHHMSLFKDCQGYQVIQTKIRSANIDFQVLALLVKMQGVVGQDRSSANRNRLKFHRLSATLNLVYHQGVPRILPSVIPLHKAN